MDQFFSLGQKFLLDYFLLAIFILLTLGFFAFRNPKEFFKIGIMVFIVGTGIYFITLISDATGIGSKQKELMIFKTKNAEVESVK